MKTKIAANEEVDHFTFALCGVHFEGAWEALLRSSVQLCNRSFVFLPQGHLKIFRGSLLNILHSLELSDIHFLPPPTLLLLHMRG